MSNPVITFRAKQLPLNLFPQFGRTEVHQVSFNQDEGFFTTDDPRIIAYLRDDPRASTLCEEVTFEETTIQVPVARPKAPADAAKTLEPKASVTINT